MWRGRKADYVLPVAHLFEGEYSRTAFRAIGDKNYTQFDFTSHYERGMTARGIEVRSTPLWQAISMFTNRRSLESRMEMFPAIGSAIAEVELEPGRGIAIAETCSPTHISVWADPKTLDNAVIAVYDV